MKPARSETFFLQVVHVKPVVHDTIARDVFLNVVLHEFLRLQRQVAGAQSTLLVVPGADSSGRPCCSVFANPRSTLVTGGPRGDKRPERVVVDLGKLQPALIERAVQVVLSLPSNEDGAA